MAWLVLKDGKAYEGEAFGYWMDSEPITGEVVFNTSMCGYQEMITDLSYSGQILTFTHPQIGNYGWHNEESEAGKVLIKGVVVKELSDGEGSYHADRSMEEFCLKNKIPGMQDIDTRALTRHIRQNGTIPGVFVKELEQGIKFWQEHSEEDIQPDKHWVYQTTVSEEYEIHGEGPLLAVLDMGIKRNILRCLQRKGFRLQVFPASTPWEEILNVNPRETCSEQWARGSQWNTGNCSQCKQPDTQVAYFRDLYGSSDYGHGCRCFNLQASVRTQGRKSSCSGSLYRQSNNDISESRLRS
jgi:carbamoyl-phosphate synthase small subunit